MSLLSDKFDKLGQPESEFELRHEVWAERLSTEYALMLIPFLDTKIDAEKCKRIAGRLAMVAAKRAREASALDDDEPMVPCRGCRTKIPPATSACLCTSCLLRFGLVREEPCG